MPTEFPIPERPSNGRRSALNSMGGMLWHLPAAFKIAQVLGEYSLRCVLFHNIADIDSVFTKGLGGTISHKEFEGAIKFLVKNYTPVSLQDVLSSFHGVPLPTRPVLVTFDDAYASVCQFALPICSKYKVPSVFFVNAVCLDNRQLALDNLVCYVANTSGLEAINRAIRSVNCAGREIRSLTEVFSRFLPSISLAIRKKFHQALIERTNRKESDLATEASLYLTSQQLNALADFNCEIGNHTYSHVNCRTLAIEDLREEIDGNREVLEAASGKSVQCFSVPYGSSVDLTDDLSAHLQRSGCEAAFLAEARSNPTHAEQFQLNRVSIKTACEKELFLEIEILPRLRSLRSRLFAKSSGNLNREARTYSAEPTNSPQNL